MSEEKNGKGKDGEALYDCVVYMCVDSGENSARPIQVRLQSNPNYTRLHKLFVSFNASVPWHILVQSCHGPYGSQVNWSLFSSTGILKE